MKNPKEASARIKINKLLEESGWIFFENNGKKSNIQLEPGVNMEQMGKDFEHTKKGFIDYLLLDSKGFPLCVLEAKKESIHPLSAKEQARDYAKGKNARFIILSNGGAHYLWDLEQGSPEQITEFPTQKSLEHRTDYRENSEDLAAEKVGADYAGKKRTLRDYQLEAIHALQKSAGKGERRFLFEMATGTGKTTTAGAVCKLFLKTGNAKRILFLVDRIELEDQAVKDFRNLFEGQYFVGKIKSEKNGRDWNQCHIVVSTIQTLLYNNRYREEFSPTDFEFVVSDEAHRTLGGNSRAVFEYFLGYKLGLTATPKDMLKGVDEKDLSQKNPKALEHRNLRDTYKTFGCADGNPTYRYDLKKGVDGGFLINPYIVDARTEITTELLSEEGYAVSFVNDEGGEEETSVGVRNFERNFFNEDTNRVFAKTILKKGMKDPLTGEFGKTLVFCVSQAHAAKITNLLNMLAEKKFPGKYKSDFAVQVTSSVMDAQQFTKDFSAGRLCGKSKFAVKDFPDYETSKTRICVTVGMMTTGYDCPDLLNIALLRPIFSPSDFVQMKGRGTRKNTFVYQETGESAEKKQFLLLDFFGNCEYFEKDFNYDEKVDLNISKKKGDLSREDPIFDTTSRPGEIDAGISDKLSSETIIHVGTEGMKIDRNLYREVHEQFEQVLQKSETIQKIKAEEGLEAVEYFVKTEVFNKPSEYWNAEKIRTSYEKKYKTKRKILLAEMILKAFGLRKFFKSRTERIDEEYRRFVDIEKPEFPENNPKIIQVSKIFFENFVSDSNFRNIINSGEYSSGLSDYPSFSMNDLITLNGGLEPIKSYANEYLQREMAELAFA